MTEHHDTHNFCDRCTMRFCAGKLIAVWRWPGRACVKPLFLGLLACATLPAVEIAGRTVAVDRPGDWYDPAASHHAQHAAMGVPTGLASACIDDPLTRYAVSLSSGFAVGLAYEVYQSKDGAWIDPVDASWVCAGSLLTTALADLTGEAVRILVTNDSAAVAVAWGF